MKKSPFFAKFLENQEKNVIRGGITTIAVDVNHTQKHPSDNDEDLEW